MSQSQQPQGGSRSADRSSVPLQGIPEVVPPTARSRREFFPEISEDDWKQIARDRVPGEVRFDGEANERAVFDSQFNVVRQTFAEAIPTASEGEALLRTFEKYREIVAQFTLSVLKNSNISDHLGATLSVNPQGGQQAMLRQFRLDSITSGDASYRQTPSATGQFNIVPDEGAGDGVGEQATPGEQAFIVLGYIEFEAADAVPYDYIQAEIDDTRGVYREQYIRSQVELGPAVKFIEARTPLMVIPGNEIDIDVNVVRPGLSTGLFPAAFEVVTGDSNAFGGVLG
jgi:hypothetical protein